MPQIDFYILSNRSSRETRRFICRLTRKAWKQGNRVYLHTDSQAEARQWDDLLWTFQENDFLPHDLYPDVRDSVAPVRIGYGGQDCSEIRDLLINLGTDVPDFYKSFVRVAEVVDGDPKTRERGRARFRFYRERGDEPCHHEIKP